MIPADPGSNPGNPTIMIIMFDEDYYSGRSSGYKFGYNCFDNRHFWQTQIKEVIANKNTGRILDIGCAYGFFLKHLPPTFEKFGMDISSFAIRKARAAVPKGKFSIGDISKRTAYSSRSFDVVTAFEVLEHVIKPSSALREIKRLLKPDGIAIFSFPNTASIFGRILFPMDKTHVNTSNILKRHIAKNFWIIEKKYQFNFGWFGFTSDKISLLPGYLLICVPKYKRLSKTK